MFAELLKRVYLANTYLTVTNKIKFIIKLNNNTLLICQQIREQCLDEKFKEIERIKHEHQNEIAALEEKHTTYVTEIKKKQWVSNDFMQFFKVQNLFNSMFKTHLLL